MKCDEIQEMFGVYFDLPNDDSLKQQIKRHIEACPNCAAEFELWEESASLIHAVKEETVPQGGLSPIAGKVMNRIYQDESWRMPVAGRIYSIPYKLRRNLTAVIAFCLTLFLLSFLYSITGGDDKEPSQYGFIPAASATGSISDSSLSVSSMPQAALASTKLIKPMKIGVVKATPDYLLALSFLGMISTLLIMNWLSRTRS